MRVLVVGGAGYIGSFAVRRLLAGGHQVHVFDNLSQGHERNVPDGCLTVGDLLDPAGLAAVCRRGFDAAMHFAALASVPESVADPARYWRVNVTGSLNLLDALRASGVGKVVFSSTAATYGIPARCPIAETDPQQPINPYGYTKLTVERMLADHARAYGLGYAVLRYFNACGAAADGSLGEDHTPETHLIPRVLLAAAGKLPHIDLCGTDYPTPDGTCIRDYIHVEDLADAHALVLERIAPGRGLAFNVATGRGTSVREVLDAAGRVTGRKISIVEQPRRAGDPPELVASPALIQRELGWQAKYTQIEAILETAWRWHGRG